MSGLLPNLARATVGNRSPYLFGQSLFSVPTHLSHRLTHFKGAVPDKTINVLPKNSANHQLVYVRATSATAMGRTALDEVKDGEFVRVASTLRQQITEDGSSGFPAVADRYHLYISFACPWACRCYAFLKLKGLDHVIGLTVSKPRWERTKEGEEHFGWAFATSADEEPGADVDTLNGAKTVRELYEIGKSDAQKYTVPILWDKHTKSVVNNESEDIIRMFNSQFNKLATNPTLDLYPEDLRKQIDDTNEWVYKAINNGVYRCGFASKQGPYETAFKEVFEGLDRCEVILEKQKYIAGKTLSEADIRLFVTLIRFDEVYTLHFKCNKRFIREYPNLFNYTKDVYQLPGMPDTVNMYHIKKHYYGSHPIINPYGIIPVGSNIDYSAPHNRNRFSK